MFVFINYGGKSLMTNSTSSSLFSLNARNPNWTSHTCGGYCLFPSVFDVGHNDSAQYWQRWVLAMFWVLQLMATLTMLVKEAVQIRDALIIGEMRCIPFIKWQPFNGHRNAYLLGMENILQWIYILLTLVLLAFTACSSQPVNVIRAIAGSSILISWILAINNLARYPVFERQNIHIILFCKVLKKFVVIFMIFAPYILAFSFFFYISLHNDFGPEEVNVLEVSNKDVIEKIDAKGEFLDKAGFSIIKTLAMFVGEMEFSDFPFERAPYFSHLMFIIFLFVIVIVLMNVLTALAVDETNDMKRDAKIWSQQIRIDVICKMAKFCQLKIPEEKILSLRVPEDDWWAELRHSWKKDLLRSLQERNSDISHVSPKY